MPSKINNRGPVMKLKCICCSLLLLSLLSACSSVKDVVNPYEENFKCRAKDSEGKCVDTPTAYKDARYPAPVPEPGTPPQAGGMPNINIAKLDAQNSRYKTLASLLENPEAPMLNPPKILRVLVLPYKGDNNELFMTRYAYLEIEKAQWILTDIKEK